MRSRLRRSARASAGRPRQRRPPARGEDRFRHRDTQTRCRKYDAEWACNRISDGDPTLPLALGPRARVGENSTENKKPRVDPRSSGARERFSAAAWLQSLAHHPSHFSRVAPVGRERSVVGVGPVFAELG